MNEQFCLLEDVITDLTDENIKLNDKIKSMEQELESKYSQIDLLILTFLSVISALQILRVPKPWLNKICSNVIIEVLLFLSLYCSLI
jgi:hypothetical protein